MHRFYTTAFDAREDFQMELSAAVDTVRDLARQAEVTLEVSPLPARIWADPDRIIQVLVNLLSNAIKFCDPGSTVWLTATKDLENTSEIILQVQDRGRSIPIPIP